MALLTSLLLHVTFYSSSFSSFELSSNQAPFTYRGKVKSRSENMVSVDKSSESYAAPECQLYSLRWTISLDVACMPFPLSHT